MKTQLQVCSVQEIQQHDGWIQLFPAGQFTAFDGRGPWTLKDPEGVIAASKRELVDAVIDREHATDFLPKGSDVPAAGWIKEMRVVDGAIEARVEWTERAQKEIDAKEYRYISPVFNVDKATGDVRRVLRASLTNSPALEMKAVASINTDHLSQTLEEPETMNEFLKAIAKLLGLETEDGQAVVDAVAALKKDYDTVKKEVGAADGANASQTVEAASVKFGAAKTPDPKLYVSMSAFTDVNDRLKAVETESKTSKVTASVDAAVAAGKVTPGMKAWATELASSDMDAFEKFVAAQPVILASSEGKSAAVVEGESGLTGADIQVCSMLHIPKDKMKAQGKSA